MGASVAVVLLMKERRILDAFRRASSISPASARSMEDVGINDEGPVMRRLRDREIVREGAPGTFYLDVPAWEALRKRRQRMMLVMLLVILGAVAFGILLVRLRAE